MGTSPGWSSPVRSRLLAKWLGHYRTGDAALGATVCWADGSYCTMIAGAEELGGRGHTARTHPVQPRHSTARLSSVQQCEDPLAVQCSSPQKRQST